MSTAVEEEDPIAFLQPLLEGGGHDTRFIHLYDNVPPCVSFWPPYDEGKLFEMQFPKSQTNHLDIATALKEKGHRYRQRHKLQFYNR